MVILFRLADLMKGSSRVPFYLRLLLRVVQARAVIYRAGV
jgi:hypothetical protein